jgi:F0F1-type ATP synthase membrane subunit b/b'
MPQFDSYSYSGQVFWVLAGFYLFYFFVLNFYLVQFSEVFKMRQKLIAFYSQEKKEALGLVDVFSPYLHAIFKKS